MLLLSYDISSLINHGRSGTYIKQSLYILYTYHERGSQQSEGGHGAEKLDSWTEHNKKNSSA